MSETKWVKGRGGGKSWEAQIARDYRELQMRREVEQVIQGRSIELRFNYKGWFIKDYTDNNYGTHGPFTLPSLHAKLLELKGEM